MCNVMRTNRVILNESGRISDCKGWTIRVHFDLIDTQDVIDGVRSPEFSFGNLRYHVKNTAQVMLRVISHARMILDGGGVHSYIFLNSLTAFTVLSAS